MERVWKGRGMKMSEGELMGMGGRERKKERKWEGDKERDKKESNRNSNRYINR